MKDFVKEKKRLEEKLERQLRETFKRCFADTLWPAKELTRKNRIGKNDS